MLKRFPGKIFSLSHWYYQNISWKLKQIKIQNKRTPWFYTKPKILKRGITGRPVISSVNCHSSKIQEYVDYHLQPIVREIPLYIKDTSNFLRKLKPITEVTKNSYLVTLVAKSLYTSILDSKAIKTVKISNEIFMKKEIPTKLS